MKVGPNVAAIGVAWAICCGAHAGDWEPIAPEKGVMRVSALGMTPEAYRIKKNPQRSNSACEWGYFRNATSQSIDVVFCKSDRFIANDGGWYWTESAITDREPEAEFWKTVDTEVGEIDVFSLTSDDGRKCVAFTTIWDVRYLRGEKAGSKHLAMWVCGFSGIPERTFLKLLRGFGVEGEFGALAAD